MINRTVKIFMILTLLTAVLVGIGQACGKPPTLNVTKLKLIRPQPAPDSLATLQPYQAPRIRCKVLNSNDIRFRLIDSLPSVETGSFNPEAMPKEMEQFSIDCSDSESQSVTDSRRLFYQIKIVDSNGVAVLPEEAPSPTPSPSPSATPALGPPPIFKYRLGHGVYTGRVLVNDHKGDCREGQKQNCSEREFIMQVKCDPSVVPAIEILDRSKITIVPAQIVDPNTPNRLGTQGDNFFYNIEPGAIGGGSHPENPDKYFYSWDFNGDGVFDPYSLSDTLSLSYPKGLFYLTGEELLNGNPVELLPPGLNQSFTYSRGYCDIDPSTGSCIRSTTDCFRDLATGACIPGKMKPKVKLTRQVGLRIVDQECNYVKELNDIELPFDSNNTLAGDAGLPTMAGAETQFLAGNMHGTNNNSDPRINNVHYVGVGPQRPKILARDNFVASYKRNFDSTGELRHIASMYMKGYQGYGGLSTSGVGLNGVEAEILFQDLTTAETARYGGNIIVKGKGICGQAVSGYKAMEPKVVRPCINFFRVFGAKEPEAEQTQANEYKSKSFTYEAKDCTFSFSFKREVPGSPACPAPEPTPMSHTLWILSSSTSPTSVSAREKDDVTFINGSNADIQISLVNSENIVMATSPTLNKGSQGVAAGKFKYTFNVNSVGTYRVFKSGVQMTTIQVGPAPTPSPTPSATPTPSTTPTPTPSPHNTESVVITNNSFDRLLIYVDLTRTAGNGIGKASVEFKNQNDPSTPSTGPLHIYDYKFANLTDLKPPKLTPASGVSISVNNTYTHEFSHPGIYEFTWLASTGYIIVRDVRDTFIGPYTTRVEGQIECPNLETIVGSKTYKMKFDDGEFVLKFGNSVSGMCEEPAPGPGDDGPPASPPPEL